MLVKRWPGSQFVDIQFPNEWLCKSRSFGSSFWLACRHGKGRDYTRPRNTNNNNNITINHNNNIYYSSCYVIYIIIYTQIIYTTLMKGAVRTGEFDRARQIFDFVREKNLVEHDAVSYTVMINACAKVCDVIHHHHHHHHHYHYYHYHYQL
jgi:pentatricopeptide repeat protein